MFLVFIKYIYTVPNFGYYFILFCGTNISALPNLPALSRMGQYTDYIWNKKGIFINFIFIRA